MRLLKYMLPLLVLLLWGTTAKAQYDPVSPPEPGVYFTLTTRCEPAYSVMTYTSSGTRAFGSNVSMSAYPATGFRFIQWEDEDGNVVSTVPNFTYVMPAKDVTLIAKCEYDPSSPAEPSTPEFKDVSYITIQMNPADAGYMAHGSSGEYEVGTTRTFIVNSSSNYRFVNWTCEGIELGTSSTLDYTVPRGDRVIVANFVYDPTSPAEPSTPNIPRTLTLKSNPAGATYSFTGDGSHSVRASFSVSERPNTYYHFVNWTDEDGNIVSESSSFTYTMPDRHVTLTANYTYNYDPSSPGEPGTPNPDSGMAENMVLWPRMGMYDDTHVQILCETPGATIHYTLDGTTPNAESPVYTAPVFVPSNLLVKAIAYKEGMEDSPVVSYQVTAYKTATPVFTFESLKLNITSATPDAIIRYTTDFTDPTEESEIFTAPFLPEENCRIKAYASKEGLTDSPINIFVFRRADYTIPAPTFLINDDGKLEIVPSVSGGQTWYTTDGTVPTTASTLYTEPLELDGNYIIKAYTTHINFFDSPVGEYASEGFIVAKPTYSFENPLLTLSTATEGASIRYTLDGSIPTEESTLYTAPIRLTADSRIVAKGFKDLYASSDTVVFNYIYKNFQLPTPTAEFENKHLTLSCEKAGAKIYYAAGDTLSMPEYSLYESPVALTEDCTVRFYASLEHFNDSEVGSFDFKVARYQAAAPVLTYDPATLTVTMTCETENAEIRYTRDGSIPTATTGTVYDGPAQVVCNQTFTAVAFRSDMFASEPASVVVNDQKVPTPTASFGNKVLTLACANPEAQIRYTIDGTEPSAESTLYSGPVALNADCTVLFYASCQDFNDSEVASFEFKVADYQAAAPTLTYNKDAKTVTMACATEGAEIRYTIDGEAPTESTGVKYEGPIAVLGNHTYTAKAFRSDLFASAPASLTVDAQKVPTPTASLANKMLTLSCTDKDATIHYTTDGTTPTAESPVYSAPLEMSADCTVKFIAVRELFNDSDVASYVFKVADLQVAAPVITYDADTKTVSMTCATENAEIRYTIDGITPTETTGEKYEGPIAVVGNHTYTARAFHSDLFASETVSMVIDSERVPTPTASYAAKSLTLSCADPDASIYYTTDGSAPSASSRQYTAPIALTSDCTVRFIAVRESFLNSVEGSYTFNVTEHQVAKPVVNHSLETLKVTMTTATEGATIRYTTDGTEPTVSTGTVYTAPVDLTGNATFTVRAFHSDYFDSDVTVYEVSDMKLPVPTAAYGKHALTLACEDNTAQIHYTTDGSAPTAASALYSAPIPLTADCTVRFIATKTGFVSSDEGSYAFVLADWQEAIPTISKDFAGRKITINQAKSLPVNVTIDGNVQSLQTPATLDVTPGMTTVTAVAVAQDEDRYDSPAMSDAIVFHKAPAISYDGHTLRVTLADGEPAAASAERQLFIDGKLAANGNFDLSKQINAFCNVTARVQSENAFISDPADMRIDVYNTGRVAAARNGHRLAEAFGTWGDKADSYEYLRLGGELSRADIDVVAALPKLNTLHIEVDSLAAEDYAGALAGTRIETIFSNEYPEGMLTGMPRLTTLMWGRTDSAIPDGRVKEAGNPNLLFWTPDIDLLPADACNTVVYDYVPDGVPTDPDGTGVSGRAETIHLFDGCPFKAHMPLTTGYIDFKKIFHLPTEIDICAGWETIVLPFTAETISHERQGAIVPFAAWDGQNDPYGDIKPFWLYSSNEDGWKESPSLQAGVPYIISMPNNKDYVESSNLDGEVTFWTGEETWLGTPESAPKTTPWKDGSEFTGTFMPVEEEGILSMNVNAKEGEYAGSAFTDYATTLPFGAYVWAPGQPQAIPVFTDGSGVKLPTLTYGGIVVETPAPGMLRISSNRDCHTAIFTPEGATVRVIDLQAGESLEVDGLTRGLYIVAGVKVMVK